MYSTTVYKKCLECDRTKTEEIVYESAEQFYDDYISYNVAWDSGQGKDILVKDDLCDECTKYYESFSMNYSENHV